MESLAKKNLTGILDPIPGRFRLGKEQLALAAIAFAIFAFPWAAKPYVDTFSLGTSYARVYGFAAYLAAIAATSIGLSLANIKVPEIAWKVQLLLVAFLFAYGFFGETLFSSTFAGSSDTIYVSFDQQGYSTTAFKHIHVLKAIFCQFNPDQEDVDCARPFMRFYPPIYFDIARVAWLVAAILSVLVYSNFSRVQDKAAYAILSFASLRTAVDGGLLSTDFISFSMLAILLIAKNDKFKLSLLGAPLGASIVVILSLWLSLPTALSSTFPALLCLVYPLGFFLSAPRERFPALLLVLATPLLVSVPLVENRWSDEACVLAGANYTESVEITGTYYTSCRAEVALPCGNISLPGNGNLRYSGAKVRNAHVLISKALSSECGYGVFTLSNSAVDPN